MATRTDSDTIGVQLDERMIDYIERRGWVRALFIGAVVCAVGMYPTLAAGDSTSAWVLGAVGIGMLHVGKAYSSNGYSNAAYNMTVGRLIGPIDETAEDMRGDLGWQ